MTAQLSTLIVAYENGDLHDDEVRELFQELLDTGVVYQLQGAYGREAHRMIEEGLISWK